MLTLWSIVMWYFAATGLAVHMLLLAAYGLRWFRRYLDWDLWREDGRTHG